MSTVMYALVLHRGGYPVHQDNGPLLAVLDLDVPLVTKAQLNRHLSGELRRQGIREDQWFDYEIRVHALDHRGDPERTAKYRWAWVDDEGMGR